MLLLKALQKGVPAGPGCSVPQPTVLPLLLPLCPPTGLNPGQPPGPAASLQGGGLGLPRWLLKGQCAEGGSGASPSPGSAYTTRRPQTPLYLASQKSGQPPRGCQVAARGALGGEGKETRNGKQCWGLRGTQTVGRRAQEAEGTAGSDLEGCAGDKGPGVFGCQGSAQKPGSSCVLWKVGAAGRRG